MKKTFFDAWELNQAMDLMDQNPLIANYKLQEYIKKYPKDYSAKICYIATLISLRNLTEAEKELEDLESLLKQDEYLKNKVRKKTKIKLNIISSRLRLLSYQEKYEDLYNFYYKHIMDVKDLEINVNPLIFYCKKKLNMLDPNKRDSNTYIFKQIVRYEEKDFLEHLKKHLTNYDSSKNAYIFNNDFPIEKILTEIKKYIPSENCLYPYLYADAYIFKYDACGTDKDKVVDYFKVICLHNTSDIITMCPVSGHENWPHIDLNYLNEEKEKPKKRTLSQIDKFNKRYNINN